MAKKGKVRKKYKLRIKVFLKLLAFLIAITFFLLWIYNIKIKNIYIEGNDIISDVEIIELAGISNYPKLYSLNKKEMKENIKQISLIKDVNIKRNIFGKITIEVDEMDILFFYKYNNKYITITGDSIEDNKRYMGYPTLINFTPDTVLEELIIGLNKVDLSIIEMINEIEYTPYKTSDGKVIDETRFTLKMNDSNTVIIDTVNIRKLNDYSKIFASIGMDTTKGTLYLDTITEDNIYFESYEAALQTQQEKLEKEQNKEEENVVVEQ